MNPKLKWENTHAKVSTETVTVYDAIHGSPECPTHT